MTGSLFVERPLDAQPSVRLELFGDLGLVTRGMLTSDREHAFAVTDKSGSYRYLLGRVWCDYDPAEQFWPIMPLWVFCMLNPSDARHNVDDPTIRKCRGFAKRGGAGGFLVVNLFAYSTPYPKRLVEAHRAGVNVVGESNESVLRWALSRPVLLGRNVAAWGKVPPRLRGVVGRESRPGSPAHGGVPWTQWRRFAVPPADAALFAAIGGAVTWRGIRQRMKRERRRERDDALLSKYGWEPTEPEDDSECTSCDSVSFARFERDGSGDSCELFCRTCALKDCRLYENAPYVCPGCYAVGGEHCAPDCIDAELAQEREECRDSDRYDDDQGDWDDGEERTGT